MVAETRDRLAGDSIQRIDKVHHSNQYSLVLAVGPICQSAVRLGASNARVKFPEQFAGRCVEREDFLGWSYAVQHALNNNGTRLQAAFFLGIETPHLRELLDVVAVDLCQSGKMIVLGISAPDGPVALFQRHIPTCRTLRGPG